MKQQLSRMMARKFANQDLTLPPYNPAADFDWIRWHSRLPWLRLDLQVPWQEILKEIQGSKAALVPHRDDYSEHQGWLSGCLHGRAWAATREDSYYQDQTPFDWTAESQQYFAFTKDFFQSQWPATQYRRLRIMLLEPKGYITLHRDSNNPGLNAVNIAITQPADCKFVFENHGVIPFEPGSAFWIDTSINHTVYNDSDQPRWHMIVHQHFDDLRFQELVAKSYHMLYNKEL